MGGPAPTELRLEFRDLTTNMGLRNGFSNTLRWSPMPGAALSTTLLDPLQWPGACNGPSFPAHEATTPRPDYGRKRTNLQRPVQALDFGQRADESTLHPAYHTARNVSRRRT